jgi:hypothetical protein
VKKLNKFSFECCDWCFGLLNFTPPEGVTFDELKCVTEECCFYGLDHYSILETFSRVGIRGRGIDRAQQDKRRFNSCSSKHAAILAAAISQPRRIVEIKTDSNGNEFFEAKL